MRPVKANKRMRQLIYIMITMALLSSCQQKGDKNMTSEELMRKEMEITQVMFIHWISSKKDMIKH